MDVEICGSEKFKPRDLIRRIRARGRDSGTINQKSSRDSGTESLRFRAKRVKRFDRPKGPKEDPKGIKISKIPQTPVASMK